MHPSIEKAIDEIDAAMFSGDTFMDPSNHNSFQEQLDRWQRGLDEFAELITDEES